MWHKRDTFCLDLQSRILWRNARSGDTWKKINKWECFPSPSESGWCSTLGYILHSTRLSGRAFVEADTTKYGPLEEIKCSYQGAMWSLLSRTNLLLLSRALEHSEILFSTLSFIFHAFPLCVSNLPRKLTVAALFSIHLFLYSTRSRSLHGGAEIHLYRLQPRAQLVSAEVAPYQRSLSFRKKNPALQTLFHFPFTFFHRIGLSLACLHSAA